MEDFDVNQEMKANKILVKIENAESVEAMNEGGTSMEAAAATTNEKPEKASHKKAKNGRKKKKRPRGGKKFKDWLQKEEERKRNEANALKNREGNEGENCGGKMKGSFEDDRAASISSINAKKGLRNFALHRIQKRKREAGKKGPGT
uniref:Uncharacterized protein n=1 Tax=Globodera rostochiensis TaxID=31243 RepID=A0A914IC17_GLORO